MEITLNDKLHSVKENSSLYDLVCIHVGEKQKGIAVAVNDAVIPKTSWESYIVRANDTILIIKATQGG
ncbi:MAG: thiamine biosynthesis protein ThiS [Bacteroidota bacterium]|jgi:sulfur carrier protein|nr:thiamine biosynthesis protein ThiS [Bacteroidota bacterium]